MKLQPPEGTHITYQQQYRKCGKPQCKCHTSAHAHGPYWYGYWHEKNKSRKIHGFYIGKNLPETAA